MPVPAHISIGHVEVGHSVVSHVKAISPDLDQPQHQCNGPKRSGRIPISGIKQNASTTFFMTLAIIGNYPCTRRACQGLSGTPPALQQDYSGTGIFDQSKLTQFFHHAMGGLDGNFANTGNLGHGSCPIDQKNDIKQGPVTLRIGIGINI